MGKIWLSFAKLHINKSNDYKPEISWWVSKILESEKNKLEILGAFRILFQEPLFILNLHLLFFLNAVRPSLPPFIYIPFYSGPKSIFCLLIRDLSFI